jgi:NAD(P)-dependent dehydrogenase (short-subunit alcohol dehydrogenase family)
MTTISSYTAADWVKTLHTNLTAPFLVTQALIPLLMKANNASIIFTTDAGGQNPNAYWGAYGVSKAGIDNLMVTLAEELENTTNIRVNSIQPGPIRTALRRNAFPGEVPMEVPLPESIMPSYLYLMGKDSLDTHKQVIAAQEK